MTLKEVSLFLSQQNDKQFNIVLKSGNVIKKRLFYNTKYFERPCEYIKNSKNYGRFLSESEVSQWEIIKPIKRISNEIKVRKFMEKVVKYLTISGLWITIKNDYIYLLSLPNDEFNNLINMSYCEQHDVLMKKHNNVSFHVDNIIYTAKKGIKCINYNKFEKSYLQNIFKDAIQNKKEINHRWRKNYDNSFSIRSLKNETLAWYSEEFKNCANGHYYFALDEKHAIFVEHD